MKRGMLTPLVDTKHVKCGVALVDLAEYHRRTAHAVALVRLRGQDPHAHLGISCAGEGSILEERSCDLVFLLAYVHHGLC